ncbi:hypothetical protein MKX03_008085 [Papaver bracteatum]|nr:hypothetical protein MKX03_008085 [Papaver bracteatum]
MYRFAAKRILVQSKTLITNPNNQTRNLLHLSRLITTTTNAPDPNFPQKPIGQDATNVAEKLAAETLKKVAEEGADGRSQNESRGREREGRPRVEYKDEQARVLQASLPHVLRLGWSEAAQPLNIPTSFNQQAVLIDEILHASVKDAFDLEKTVQEAKYLAEAVGAGIGRECLKEVDEHKITHCKC